MSNATSFNRTPMDKLVEALTPEDRLQLMIEGNDYEMTGVTGDTFLRAKALEFQKKIQMGASSFDALYISLLVTSCHKVNSIQAIEASMKLDDVTGSSDRWRVISLETGKPMRVEDLKLGDEAYFISADEAFNRDFGMDAYLVLEGSEDRDPLLMEINSDDYIVNCMVDITDWLETADKYLIEEIRDADWSYTESVDRLIEEMEEQGNPSVIRLMKYIELRPTMPNGDQVGFAGRIDDPDGIITWLKDNRPDVHDHLEGNDLPSP